MTLRYLLAGRFAIVLKLVLPLGACSKRRTAIAASRKFVEMIVASAHWLNVKETTSRELHALGKWSGKPSKLSSPETSGTREALHHWQSCVMFGAEARGWEAADEIAKRMEKDTFW